MSHFNALAVDLRARIIQLSHENKVAHLGSCLSCADILLAALHGGLRVSPETAQDPLRDRLIFSKGHCATALVCALAQRGYCSFEHLQGLFNKEGGIQEHPNLQCVPGVENASGSLGHGLPIGLGLALAARIQTTHAQGHNFRVCVVMGDGECNEGSIWEAAMLAGGQKVQNLCVVVDFNKWQATGRSCDITALEPMAEKWRAFGWDAVECDGHDIDALIQHLQMLGTGEKPLALIAHTIKGKGISFMEDDNNWHYRVPNVQEYTAAMKELGRI